MIKKKRVARAEKRVARAQRGGFTLVELLVAMALFSIAISVAVGGFVRALRTQRQLIALIAANSNASLAIEEIAREMRTGYDFACAGSLSPCEELQFTSASGEAVRYRTVDGALERGTGASFQRMTAENVFIQDLWFSLNDNNGRNPPLITVTLGVSGRGRDAGASVTTLQTSVSSRNF